MNHSVEVFDVYDYFYTPIWHQQWFIALVVLCSLMVVGLVLYRVVMRSRQKELSPYEHSLAKLEQLEYAGYSSKEFYFLFTTILKEYLSCIYSLNLSSRTDSEVINAIKQEGITSSIVDLIEQILTGTITIKFANKKAEREKMTEDLNRCIKAIKFINYKNRLDTSDTL